MGLTQSRQKLQPPWELKSTNRQEWLEWRRCFCVYMNENFKPPYKQVRKFFKYIGYVGEDIANYRLYFHSCKENVDLKTLLFKFDVYFIFSGVKRQYNQNIEDYVESLKEIAEKSGSNRIEDVVREKVLQDFRCENIFQQLETKFLASRISNYELLSLYELLFLWIECKKPLEVQQYLRSLQKQQKTSNSLAPMKNLCGNCGLHHNHNICFARGQNCWKCGELNHFARCCSKSHIFDCGKCGSNHPMNNCPAYEKLCSKCKEIGHFSWKCYHQIIQSCMFCGTSHINNRQFCTANNARCNNCLRIGHFTHCCLTRRHQRSFRK